MSTTATTTPQSAELTRSLYLVCPADSLFVILHRASMVAQSVSRPRFDGPAALGLALAVRSLTRYTHLTQAERACDTHAAPGAVVLHFLCTPQTAEEATCGLPDYHAPGLAATLEIVHPVDEARLRPAGLPFKLTGPNGGPVCACGRDFRHGRTAACDGGAR